jgi:hypothetical protein
MFNKLKTLHKLWTQLEPYKDIVGVIMAAIGYYSATISFDMKPFYYFLIFWIIFLITSLFGRLKKDANLKENKPTPDDILNTSLENMIKSSEDKFKNKLSNWDICKIAGGSFNEDLLLFSYDKNRFLEIWNYCISLENSFSLPNIQKMKTATVFFKMNRDIDFTIYIKENDEYISVSKMSFEKTLNCEVITKFDFKVHCADKDAKLIIYLKSFTL